jgi:hypothetical protein
MRATKRFATLLTTAGSPSLNPHSFQGLLWRISPVANLRVGDALFSIIQEEEGEYKARSFNFQSPEVHRLNYVVPLNCVGHELEYLRYFMYVVRGDLGAFRLLEGSALAEAREHLGPELEKRIKPTRFKRVAADGGIVFEANVLYGKDVFSSDLEVYPDGAVEMLEDRRIAQDIEALAE